jgi:hypothetical protein
MDRRTWIGSGWTCGACRQYSIVVSPNSPSNLIATQSAPSAALDLDDVRWLVSPEAECWLAEAAAGEPTVALAARLRAALSAPRVHLILEQTELRRRARAKFSRSGSMFFTRTGLEQATDEHVASYKAGRFPTGAAVCDLCCGIGGDLVALAGRGPVVGVDRDERAAIFAAANLRACHAVHDVASASVVLADATRFGVDRFAACHIDPDRRPGGHRTTRVELHDPGPAAIDHLRAHIANVAVKLAPAAVLPQDWCAEADLEWIGRGGECRQLVAWFGRLAQHAGRRRATLVGPGGKPHRTVVGNAEHEAPVAERVGRYLYEPDTAVLAAHLSGTLAGEHGLAQLAPGIAYYTGDRLVRDAALAAFEITDILPLDMKRLRNLLRERDVGRLEIKKRGVEHDPDRVRRQLQPRGDTAATLILTRWHARATALVARRAGEHEAICDQAATE